MTAPERKCLAAFYRLNLTEAEIKGTSAARLLGVSRAFVSRVASALKAQNLLLKSDPIILTQEGSRLAALEFKRVDAIGRYLVKNMNSTDEIAWTDALNILCALSPRNTRALDYLIKKADAALKEEA